MGAKYSLAGVVVCITGQRSDNAHRAFNDVLRIDPDITHLVSDVNLVDSLVGVVVCITGETPRNAKHAIDEIVNRRDRDVCQKITDVNLIDSRGRRTA